MQDRDCIGVYDRNGCGVEPYFNCVPGYGMSYIYGKIYLVCTMYWITVQLYRHMHNKKSHDENHEEDNLKTKASYWREMKNTKTFLVPVTYFKGDNISSTWNYGIN